MKFVTHAMYETWVGNFLTPLSLRIALILSSSCFVFFSSSFHIPARTPGDMCSDPGKIEMQCFIILCNQARGKNIVYR